MEIDLPNLRAFLYRASGATYAGSGKPVVTSERPGFIELVYAEDPWLYRDSYAGHSRSRGTEVVRYQGMPIWCSLYGGGMIKGNEQYASETFAFLKDALSQPSNVPSMRGPKHYTKDDFVYIYRQNGDIDEFAGHEEITLGGKVVFFHEVMGGLIISD